MINPATGQPIPVFVASYVLMEYGTGAIMAVPAHDQRDFEFARQAGLPVEAAVRPPAGWLAGHGLDPDTPAATWPEAYAGDGSSMRAAGGWGWPGSGRRRRSMPRLTGWATRASAGAHGSYRLRDWLFSRQRYWGEPFPVVYDQDDRPIGLPESQLPVTLPEMTDFRPDANEDEQGDPVPPLARAADWATVELDLGDGPKRYRRELNTMPQWAGSCWYYLRYLDPANEDAFISPDVEQYWMVPQAPRRARVASTCTSEAWSTRCCTCCTRASGTRCSTTWGMSRRRSRSGGCSTRATSSPTRSPTIAACTSPRPKSPEADGSCTYRGLPVTRRSGKMGKSLKNSVSPDDMYAAYGADTLRLYEMAMGPLDVSRPWRTNDVVGVHRFLQRLWRSIIDEETGQLTVTEAPLGEETTRRLHRTIMIVSSDFRDCASTPRSPSSSGSPATPPGSPPRMAGCRGNSPSRWC